ncbi:MAG: D-methionine transport system substrate-binding protein, partial [Mycobacterium sp.]|nr:D-methionine transport system substrate-binding protein [Mycobacterium sp.]
MTTTPTTPVDETNDHGFELKRRPKRIWLVVGLVVVIAAVVGVRFFFFGDTKSPNEIAGATLVVATNEGNAAEQSLIEYIAREVAPRHGINVAFRGLADSNTINRAVSDGEVAG